MKLVKRSCACLLLLITCYGCYASEIIKTMSPWMSETFTFNDVIAPNLNYSEIELCVNKHNELRRQEGASDMYHMVSYSELCAKDNLKRRSLFR